jgi:hypothetical protein
MICIYIRYMMQVSHKPSKKDRSCAESPDAPLGFDSSESEGNKGVEVRDVDVAGTVGAEDLLKSADVVRDAGPPKTGCGSGAAWLDIESVPGGNETLGGESSLVKKSHCACAMPAVPMLADELGGGARGCGSGEGNGEAGHRPGLDAAFSTSSSVGLWSVVLNVFCGTFGGEGVLRGVEMKSPKSPKSPESSTL